MYIRYTKLWKLLLEKGMHKTDLIELAGISSRTLAKLSKNQSVTTDTLLAICAALHCDIADIAEACEGEEALSVYEAFKKHACRISEDEYCITYALSYQGKNVLIRRTKERANKHTFIKCMENGSVVWERLHPDGHPGTYATDARVIVTAPSFWRKDSVCILLISGRPGSIDSLDEGWFVSARGTPKRAQHIFVMSEAAFKPFSL